MKYKAKLWLSKRQYMAVLDNYIVIVTLDKNGNEIKWSIFGEKPFMNK